MRVLHIYAGNLYGGIETMLATIARSPDLCPSLESHFALCFEGRLSDEITSARAPLYRLGAVQVRRPWTVWRARRALAEALRRDSFHAVICHSPWPLAIFGPVVRAAGRPLVFWLHEYLSGRSWIEKWARRCPPDLAI